MFSPGIDLDFYTLFKFLKILILEITIANIINRTLYVNMWGNGIEQILFQFLIAICLQKSLNTQNFNPTV